MKTWAMADPHFGHVGIIDMMSRVQPGTNQLFNSIEEHDQCIIDSINSVVDRNDRLVIVGDICYKDPQKYRKQIKCRNIVIVLGNHDKRSKIANSFGQPHDLLELKIPCQGFRQRVVFSHYPFAIWNKSYEGSIHLYGHCHGMVESRLNSLFPGRRAMDIGVDPIYDLTGSYVPLDLEEIICVLLQRKPGHDDLAYYKAYQEKRNQEKLR